MTNTQQITLDLSSSPSGQYINAKQGDCNTRFIECILKNNNQGAEFESDVTAYFVCQKPDKTHVANYAELSGSTVIIELTDQCLTAAGVCNCEITFQRDGAALTTATFQIIVQPSAYDADSVESSDEYGIFTDGLKQVDDKMEEIEVWSQNIETNLEGDTAANLQLQINRVNNSVSSVSQLASQMQSGLSGVYTTKAALTAAYPNGDDGVYVVQGDGHWYYWSDSAWTDGGVYMGEITVNSIDNDKIENFSIEPLKTKFNSELRNLLDPANMTQGYIQSASTSSEYGKTIISNSTYISTLSYVPIQSGQTYLTIGRCRSLFFYDSAMNCIQMVDGTSSAAAATAEIPDSAAFFRCSIVATLTNLHEQYANYGNSVLPYSPYGIQSDIKLTNKNYMQNSIINYPSFIDFYHKAQVFAAGKNLINEKAYETGYISENNVVADDSNYRTCMPALIEPSTVYTVNTARKIMMYDENLLPVKFIDLSGSPSHTFTSNENACFIRVSYPHDSEVQLEAGSSVTAHEPHCYQLSENTTSSELKGKSMLFTGDSICQGTDDGYSGGYPSLVSEQTGAEVKNIGQGGGTVAQISDRFCISQSLVGQSEDYDYIILQGGTNDILYSSLGTLDPLNYSPSLDILTFTGGLETLLMTASKLYPGKKVGYIICHNMSSRNAETQAQYNERIRECCRKWSVPFLDLYYKSGMNTNLRQIRDSYTVSGDGTHPNEDGYSTYYVPKIISWLKTL